MGTSPSGPWFTQGSISRLVLGWSQMVPVRGVLWLPEKFGEFQCTVAAVNSTLR